YYTFGPYDKTKGKKIGDYYRFTLTAKAIRGDDANLFRLVVEPDSADVFSENITIRLLPNEGDKMYFYPEVPVGTRNIVIHNYDLDAKGGSSELHAGRWHFFEGERMTVYDIKDSKSGEWVQTKIPVRVEGPGRFTYVITKGTQKYAHAGIKIEDGRGKPIPIYFQKGKPVVVKPKLVPKPIPRLVPDLKCNRFTFDATDSYDIDKQDLTFLWEFGDGQTSTDPVITHIYEKGGEYTVRLTATDDSGLECDTAVTTQTVKVNTPPIAAFTLPELICSDDEVTLDASRTTDDTSENLSYSWSLGDGTTTEGIRASKSWQKGGTYKVSLTVDDNEDSACSTDTIQQIIRVNTPPVADAGNDIDKCLEDYAKEYKVTLNGSGSRDSDGDNLTYSWNLGDGTTKSGRTVTHIYEKAGKYKVTLTVDDGTGSACSVDTDSILVSLNKSPKASIYTRDSKICIGDEVIFDGSSSVTEKGERLTYIWDFGDGTTGKGVKTAHRYSKSGKYNATLTVDDGKGTGCSKAIATACVDVNSPPIAKLQGPGAICSGKTASFDASGSYDPDGDRLTYRWDFGDGTTQDGSSRTSHSYKEGGVYNVRVTIDDNRGYTCSAASSVVRVKVNAKPVADAGPNLACCINEKTYFNGSNSSDPDGDRLTYRWDFGDGTTGEGAKVSHEYTEPGMYKVVLTVDDNQGTECSTDSDSFMATVNASPVAIIKVR
ncbi:MAG: PKD domain-containing protein, partial [Candidatus Omnitrophica bacterium]|nr:PKD domain-containing protein [Candidatus Omnitrophota bacterium]